MRDRRPLKSCDFSGLFDAIFFCRFRVVKERDIWTGREEDAADTIVSAA